MSAAGPVRTVAMVSVGLLVTGCVSTVDGAAARTSPRYGSTTPLGQIMPSDEEIRAAVGNELQQNPPPRTGGLELLPDGFHINQDASPVDCIGTTTPGLRVVYEKRPVRDVAVQDYWNYGLDVAASGATAVAVRLASAADAQRLFTSFVEQWHMCSGITVALSTLDSSKDRRFLAVGDVGVRGPILSATVMSSDLQQSQQVPVERALSVESDVIVDVAVTVRPGNQIGSRAIDLVKAMVRRLAGTN